MKTEKHNGWTNYETWLVKLWMDNDKGSNDYWLENAQGYEGDVYNFSGYIKDTYTDEFLPELEGMYSDLLNSALSVVNWDEIARHFIEDARELAEYESNNKRGIQ